jgi:hypothetical protein
MEKASGNRSLFWLDWSTDMNKVMFSINKRNIIALLTAIIVSGAFLWIVVLCPPSGFNMLPLTFYDESSGITETQFIKRFDLGFAIFLLGLTYVLARNCFKAYGLFKS